MWWKQPTSTTCEKAFRVTSRKYFKGRDQRFRWMEIEKAMVPLDGNNRVKMPTEWVLSMIEWAETRNKMSRSITFDDLMAAIENESQRVDWGARIVRSREKLAALRTKYGTGSTSVRDYVETGEPERSRFEDYDPEEEIETYSKFNDPKELVW